MKFTSIFIKTSESIFAFGKDSNKRARNIKFILIFLSFFGTDYTNFTDEMKVN